jgi:hypothetical protein
MLIGDSRTYLATSHIVSLVAKLLDFEKNMFADVFNQILGECSIELIKEMKLEGQIKYQAANENNDGIFIVDQYI